MIKLKSKPKIKIGKLFKKKKIDLKSLDTELEYKEKISDDVSFDLKCKADLNYQNSNLGFKNRVKSFKFGFTKKF